MDVVRRERVDNADVACFGGMCTVLSCSEAGDALDSLAVCVWRCVQHDSACAVCDVDGARECVFAGAIVWNEVSVSSPVGGAVRIRVYVCV